LDRLLTPCAGSIFKTTALYRRQFVGFALAIELAFTVAFGTTMWLMILDNRALAYTAQIDLSS
jgi:hypothetical protein